MAKFHKQEEGLMVPPPGFDKWHVSWTIENVLEGFRHFYSLHARWPIAEDLQACDFLPTARTLERKFGGIVAIRKLLNVKNPHYNSGIWRAERAQKLWKRAFQSEENTYQFLKQIFHEPFVHNQGRIALGEGRSGRADFIVFHKMGKFFVDVFYPDKSHNRFITNCGAKVRTYKSIDTEVFCVITNPEVTPLMIENFVSKTKSRMNPFIRHLPTFFKEVTKYHVSENESFTSL